MKPSCSKYLQIHSPQTARVAGRSTPILMLFVFLSGTILAGVWFKYGARAASGSTGLSNQTVGLLHHLNAPVELRFYSILPAGSAPEPLQDFSRRVDHLLSEFQNADDGQIRVIRNLSTSRANADAAAADGIRPFNLDKGDACFLGITVASGGHKESLSRIQPEWEPALPFDVARAILQVTAAPSSPPVKASPRVSPETTNEILHLIPDVSGTSLEDGIRILREAAVDKFSEAGAEMEKQIQAAQQQASNAQNGPSEADKQAAMKHLQQVQLEQAEKLKALAAQLQAQVSAFEQMKAVPPAAN